LARLLATAVGTALTGREPMNPRGRQYALGGTLHGWTELTSLSARQRRALYLAYRGCNPMVFSRYGRRQWAAPLPWTRLVVKDPFAVLSIPVIARSIGVTAVLLFRHPGAALASYRRMGWQPDLDELRPVLDHHRAEHGSSTGLDLPRPGDTDEADAMGRFWSALYEIALDGAEEVPGLIVLSHEELASGGVPAAHQLFRALQLRPSAATDAELSPKTQRADPTSEPAGLHNLQRAPQEVAGDWRHQLTPAEIERIEQVTEPIRARLQQLRLRLDTAPDQG
jgi:hypothetical protein